jgi:hypothetical protein
MNLGVKILITAAVLCLFLWGAFLSVGAQPLKEIRSFTVIYGEQEEFYADAAVYQKVRNETLFLLHLPRARSAYRWWSIDFKNMTINLIGAPHSLGSRKYLLRGDQNGVAIAGKDGTADWSWHFTEQGTSFSGNGFMCTVRKPIK